MSDDSDKVLDYVKELFGFIKKQQKNSEINFKTISDTYVDGKKWVMLETLTNKPFLPQNFCSSFDNDDENV